ncbi:hypothetical protein BDY19DRAFT_987327 [Irpex rosettiformis]|uniref:Uncharacterized protein n=1 Tax=Irpex rosettiformis TaxID=378272 RepID=A0ACB8TS96_9APHY|nr:hypothetical protein BDY19DRAFT_987327 [Irpex rosettiformis]
MTVTHRTRQHQPEEIQTVNEPGLQIQCDGCACDLTHSIRIKCADPICEPGDGVDICPSCFCAGKEFGKHKREHPYRVVELHSYPIFTEDWGADEELLLLEGISLQGLGNWQAIAEHVGTHTKEEVEKHYRTVYIDSLNWPIPRMDLSFDIDPEEFQERKRRRISKMNAIPPPAPKVAPTSAPGIHEVAGFLPGRLEFEHELDNEAEDLVKDLEFGICMEWGGDKIPEDDQDIDVKARAKLLEETKMRESTPGSKRLPNGLVNGIVNGHRLASNTPKPESPPKTEDKDGNPDEEADEPTLPPPIETKDSLQFKLTLLEMYQQRVDKRHEAKALIFDRGLLSYKQMQANERKRIREDKEIVHRLRPFARLQTAEDFEAFAVDILWEHTLRKRIAELQSYRRLGLLSEADITKFHADDEKRNQVKASWSSRDYYPNERHGNPRASIGRQSAVPDSPRESGGKAGQANGAGPPGRKMPQPLNLANSPSLHLLTPEEQTLCSQLRILPKPYLVIKETLVREYARRGGKLRRRETRDLVKIDVNKTSRIWDFLVQAGFMRVGPVDPSAAASQDASRISATPSLSASPSKESTLRSPVPPYAGTPSLAAAPFNFTLPSSFSSSQPSGSASRS